jgi:hypothetical protein
MVVVSAANRDDQGTSAAHAPRRQVYSGAVVEDLDRCMDSFGSFEAFESPVDVVVPHGGQRHPFADHDHPQNFKITGGSKW